jgi:hypothetical protein
MKTINNELIRSFNPCYNPLEVGISDEETLSVVGWVEKYRTVVKSKSDIIWLLCRKEFMSDKDLRLFAVWCARNAYKYCIKEYPIDPRTIAAVDCAEKFAHGNASIRELVFARDAAWDATKTNMITRDVYIAAKAAACTTIGVSWDAAVSAARAARRDAWDDTDGDWDAWDAEADAQINQLMSYFK